MQIIELNEDIRDNDGVKINSCVDYLSVDVSYNNFYKEYLFANKPCVLKSVSNDWPCHKQWVQFGKPNFEFLSSQYGSATVPTANCNKKYFNAQAKEDMTFDAYLKYWKTFVADGYPEDSPCLYLKDWHCFRDYPKDEVYHVPEIFASDWLNEYFMLNPKLNDDYRFVYMGPRGTWTPLHKDVFSSFSWSVNICGRKEWVFYPPEEESLLHDSYGNLPYDITQTLCPLEFPKFTLASPIHITQEAGEAVFVPTGWFHQVWNVEDTISINHNWINGCNIMAVYQNLSNENDKVKKELSDCKESSDWTVLCQNLLNATFGLDMISFLDFISLIARRRMSALNESVPLKLPSGYFLGLKHAKFDLEFIKPVLEELSSTEECCESAKKILNEVQTTLGRNLL